MAPSKLLLAVAASSLPLCSSNDTTLYDLIIAQAEATITQVPDVTRYPSNGECPSCAGWATSSYDSWTAGFFPGILLKLVNYSTTVSHDATAAAHFWKQGVERSVAIAKDQWNNSTHDTGFMVTPTFVQQYQLTGNSTARDIAIATAHTLVKRFSPTVGCIRSWGSLQEKTFRVIIDNMMNLELLWWAADITGNATFRQIAESHSDRMIKDIYQPAQPGCVWHLVTYDTNTGSILAKSSQPQGLGTDTVWSRGQAWAIYGFTIAHRFTKSETYLRTAVDSAECFMRLLSATSKDEVPPWDFNATGVKYHKDTSAAAIAASGVIELAWQLQAPQRARYLAWARKVLDTLGKTYTFRAGESDAVLRNGTVTYPQTDIPIIYGDYYFLEALMRWDATPAEWRREALADTAAELFV